MVSIYPQEIVSAVNTYSQRYDVDSISLYEYLDSFPFFNQSYDTIINQGYDTFEYFGSSLLGSLELYANTLSNSINDSLTGAYNRRHLDDHISKINYEFERSKNKESFNAGVIMLDIDHFKSFNDEYGHIRGDNILISLVHNVKKIIRPTDFLARYGGEEFTLITRENFIGTLFLAERIREKLEGLTIQIKKNSKTHPITISAGVAHCSGSQDTMKNILENADRALYMAKESGRNVVYAMDKEKTRRDIRPANYYLNAA